MENKNERKQCMFSIKKLLLSDFWQILLNVLLFLLFIKYEKTLSYVYVNLKRNCFFNVYKDYRMKICSGRTHGPEIINDIFLVIIYFQGDSRLDRDTAM